MHKVSFVSQRTYAFPSVACGVAATMMLLKFHFRRKRVPSYRDLRKALGVYVLPSESGRRSSVLGVEPDDVAGYFRQHAIPYRATHRNTPTMWRLLGRRVRRAPAMVGMCRNVGRWGRDGHWIVVIDVSADTVTFLDPQHLPSDRRPTTMARARFRRQWDGTSIQILGFK
jgi:hypothetical protein